jgi:hypothetical protein
MRQVSLRHPTTELGSSTGVDLTSWAATARDVRAARAVDTKRSPTRRSPHSDAGDQTVTAAPSWFNGVGVALRAMSVGRSRRRGVWCAAQSARALASHQTHSARTSLAASPREVIGYGDVAEPPGARAHRR